MDPKPVEACHNPKKSDEGVALLLALIALSIFSLLGFYMMLNSTTDLRVSDNYESQVRARYAAQAGLSHARALLRGLDFSSLLRGPDGTSNRSQGYIVQARTAAFRNPLTWSQALTLSVRAPDGDLAGIDDDGLIAACALPLIPLTGIAQTTPNPYGADTITLSRYFVRVSDNNGETTELAGDPADDPFTDGDGIIVIRSMGVAQSITETVGNSSRRNSVAVFEGRYRRNSVFGPLSPLVIEGDTVHVRFDGNTFRIQGGPVPAISTIDIAPGNGSHPDQMVAAAATGRCCITGGGLPEPSITDATMTVSSDVQRTRLLDSNYLWDLLTGEVPKSADHVYSGPQVWAAGTAPYLGFYDISKPATDVAQDPKLTLVTGDLSAAGSITGGGLLVVQGSFSCAEGFAYSGLVLVAGSGSADIGGSGCEIHGGLFVVSVTDNGGRPATGTPSFSIGGLGSVTFDADAIRMALGLLPPSQTSYREITGLTDPDK